MALFSNIFFMLLAIFVLCARSVFSTEFVPVYMWETSKNYSPLPALGHINEGFFRDILLDKLNKHTIGLVFAEESLSPEDFASYDSAGNGAFSMLATMKSDAQKNYYPFVEAPLAALNDLPGIRVSKVSSSKVSDMKVKPGEIMIIDFNDAQENEGRREMLARHDILMNNLYQSIASNNRDNKVIAMLTGRHSSWVVPKEMDSKDRHTRHILATDGETDKVNLFNTSSIMMYFASTSYYARNNKRISLNNFNIKDEESNNETLVISNGDLSLKFELQDELGYWYFRAITIKDGSDEFNFTLRDAYAPVKFSYHCNNTHFSTDSKLNATLVLAGFQIQQSSGEPLNSFGDAYDCVGFTSAPIWSGLFVTFILVTIMTFGLCMIMDIKTMDRFDDPKGKTISINVSE